MSCVVCPLDEPLGAILRFKYRGTMRNNDYCNKSRCEVLKFIIQLTLLLTRMDL